MRRSRVSYGCTDVEMGPLLNNLNLMLIFATSCETTLEAVVISCMIRDDEDLPMVVAG